MRLRSLDAYRGIVILSMVFVNYLQDWPGIPAWIRHAPAEADTFTFADWVFPGFLFMAGMAIPFSFQGMRRAGLSSRQILGKVLFRSAALLLLGVIMVNEGRYSAEASGLSRPAWRLGAYLCAIVILLKPASPEAGLQLRPWKALAAATLACFLLLYRGEAAGASVWLQHSWWGILGLIGWAYLFCSLLFLALGSDPGSLCACLGLMIALTIGAQLHALRLPEALDSFVEVGPVFGGTSAIVMAGLLAGERLARSGARPGRRDLAWLLLFGLGLWTAGTWLRPLHGISKDRATESFALCTSGIHCAALAVLYGLLDGLKVEGPFPALALLGSNALLAYLIPSVLGDLFSLAGRWDLLWPYREGMAAIGNAMVLSAVVAGLTLYLTKKKVLLRA